MPALSQRKYDPAYWANRRNETARARLTAVYAIQVPGYKRGEYISVECNEQTLEYLDQRDRRISSSRLPLTWTFADGRYHYTLVGQDAARLFRRANAVRDEATGQRWARPGRPEEGVVDDPQTDAEEEEEEEDNDDDDDEEEDGQGSRDEGTSRAGSKRKARSVLELDDAPAVDSSAGDSKGAVRRRLGSSAAPAGGGHVGISQDKGKARAREIPSWATADAGPSSPVKHPAPAGRETHTFAVDCSFPANRYFDDAQGDLVIESSDQTHARVDRLKLMAASTTFSNYLRDGPDPKWPRTEGPPDLPIIAMHGSKAEVGLFLRFCLHPRPAREAVPYEMAKRLITLCGTYDAPRAGALIVSQLAEHVTKHAPEVFALAAAHGVLATARLALAHFGDSAAARSDAPFGSPSSSTAPLPLGGGSNAALGDIPPDLFRRIPPSALQGFLRVQHRALYSPELSGSTAARWAQAARSFELEEKSSSL